MDFLDPAKKKAHQTRLYIGYVLMAIGILTVSYILVLTSRGYDLDRKTGAVIQNGLVFVSARPEAADIYINGNRYKNQTDTRLLLPAGNYDVELKRQGYKTWKTAVTLEGGSIERLVYPKLFPEQMATKDALLYGSLPVFASQSPDRRWLVVAQPGSHNNFDLFDLNDENTPSTVISLPAQIFKTSEQPGTLTAVEWSTDNRHLLVKQTIGDSQEFIMIDREAPATSFNVNQLFGVASAQVALRDKRFDRLYVHDTASGVLQTADVKARTLKPLLSQVHAFKPHGDDELIYVTDKSAPPGKVNVVVLDDGKSYVVRDLPAGSGPYLLEMARFDHHWYIAAGAAKENKAYVYLDPVDALRRNGFSPVIPVALLKAAGAHQLAFSDNTRFISLQGGQEMSVYDAETLRRLYYEIKVPMAPGQLATWMDGHRLRTVSDNKSIVFDFDGTNVQTLAPSAFPPYFNRDYTALYTISASQTVPSRSALQRTELKVK